MQWTQPRPLALRSMPRAEPVQHFQCLGRIAHCGQRAKPYFSIMPGERGGGQIFEQFVDTDFARAPIA